MRLADARKAAVKALGEIMAGRHPADVVKQAAVERERREAHSVAAAVDAFIEDERGRNLRSTERTAADLQRMWLGRVRDPDNKWIAGKNPLWSARPVAEITRADIIARLDEIKRRDGKYAARHALAVIRKFFNWCADGERYGITVSPCARIRDRTIGLTNKDLRRVRVLDDDELCDVWSAAAQLGFPYGKIYQLLLLSGQRLRDISCASWGEIADGVLLIPASRYKNGHAHHVPLPPKAIAILDELPHFTAGQYIFSNTGARPVTRFSRYKIKLDEIIARRRAQDRRVPMQPWVVHDIRRTVRTRLVGDLDIESYVAERCLGHQLQGLDAVYDVGRHLPQKRDALARWEHRLMQIVEPSSPAAPGVVPMEELDRRRQGRRPSPDQ
jgi:integrase